MTTEWIQLLSGASKSMAEGERDAGETEPRVKEMNGERRAREGVGVSVRLTREHEESQARLGHVEIRCKTTP